MLVFFLVVVALSIAAFCCIIGAWLGKSGKKHLALAAPLLAAVALAAGIWATIGVPDVVGLGEENVTVAMLKHNADQRSIESWLRTIGADWHSGIAWKRDMPYGSPPLDCATDCSTLRQVAFTHSFGMCFASGVRITMRFSDAGRLESWNREDVANGC